MAEEQAKEYAVEIQEMPGGATSPGGASDFRFEYSWFEDKLLFWGWTGPNDIRVMDLNLTTIDTIELPSEDFEVHGTRWADWGSVIVWGDNGTGTGDTLLTYRYPNLELDPSFLPREIIPLKTIDYAMLVAGELMMVVAGRDENGTSQILTMETETDSVYKVYDVDGNRTIQTIGVVGLLLMALDVEGGANIFTTSLWLFTERREIIDGPFSTSLLRTDHPVTYGGANGHVLMEENFLLNQTFTYDLDDPPVQAACWLHNNNSANIIVASPKAGGGSRLQVFHNYDGEFEVGTEINTSGSVTTIFKDPYVWNVISVGFANGEFRQYNLTDLFDEPIVEEPDADEDEGLLALIIMLLPGTIIIVVIAVLVVRYFLIRRSRED
ncbi:MAG: hypothetical protein KAJ35_06260 [Thermoplasmata archaeon]|nr:hypothetical protein [Thermoplasmata archaeon]